MKEKMTMKRWCLAALLILGFLLMGQPCWAEKAYVSNKSKITLRKGPGVDHAIVAMLEEDDPVEILETDSGWSHVRLLRSDRKHLEGWVVARYLVDQIPWKIQAVALKKENERLKEQLKAFKEKFESASSHRDDLNQRLSSNNGELKELQRKYKALVADSSDFLKLRTANKKMASELETAQKSVEKLTKENLTLKSSERNRWFLSGGAVLLLGLIFGLVMGRQQKRRKSSYY
jgi:SH3 domain protein